MSFKERRIEIGAVNLRVAQNARLEEARLIVEGGSSGRPAEARRCVALQAKQVHVAQLEHVRIRSSVSQVTGLASIHFDRLVFEYEWPLLVGVTLEANSVLCGIRAHLLRFHSAVNIVAIAALDQAFVHPMMEGHVELGLLLEMASVAELRLRFLQQEFVRLRMVRGVAGGAADVVLGVLGVDGVHVLRTASVAGEAASIDILGRGFFE